MTWNRFRSTLLLAVAALCLSGTTSMAGNMPYTIDILSSDYYPELRDSWMFRINNQGVAAGYIATQTANGPYLPTIYHGRGQFQTLGIESRIYERTVTGINDRGDVVGNTNFSFPYLYHEGTVAYLTLPNNLEAAGLFGINNGGLAYGRVRDSSKQFTQVFTLLNGNLTVLPLSAPGLVNWNTGTATKMLSNGGLLGVVGSSSDGSVSQWFLYNLNTAALSALAVPGGFATASVQQITGTGLIYGYAQTADFSQTRFGFWNFDGSFREFFDAPAGTGGILFNDLGQAIGLNNGQALLYDGTTWNPLSISGLNGYTLSTLSDFNDRGQFVGLAANPARSFLWGFVATAVPEPSALVLLICGMAGVGIYARRRRPSLEGRRDGSVP